MGMAPVCGGGMQHDKSIGLLQHGHGACLQQGDAA